MARMQTVLHVKKSLALRRPHSNVWCHMHAAWHYREWDMASQSQPESSEHWCTCLSGSLSKRLSEYRGRGTHALYVIGLATFLRNCARAFYQLRAVRMPALALPGPWLPAPGSRCTSSS